MSTPPASVNTSTSYVDTLGQNAIFIHVSTLQTHVSTLQIKVSTLYDREQNFYFGSKMTSPSPNSLTPITSTHSHTPHKRSKDAKMILESYIQVSINLKHTNMNEFGVSNMKLFLSSSPIFLLPNS